MIDQYTYNKYEKMTKISNIPNVREFPFWVGCGYRAPHRPRTSKGRQDNFPSPKYFRFLFKGNLMFLKYTIRRISYIAIQTIKLCTYIHLLNTNPTLPPPFPLFRLRLSNEIPCIRLINENLSNPYPYTPNPHVKPAPIPKAYVKPAPIPSVGTLG